MSRSKCALALLSGVLIALPLASACGAADEADVGGIGGTAGTGGSGGGGTGGTAGSSGTLAATFALRIENISGDSMQPTPISPGICVLTRRSQILFEPGDNDRGLGLEALAEDGDPKPLALALDPLQHARAGVFTMPVGKDETGPAMPGESYEVELEAEPGERLALATMFAQSNDVVIATSGTGIELFDSDGMPLSSRDVSSELELWDIGTEKDEAPGFGLAQAPRQPKKNYGPREGVVSERIEPTRALPPASQLISVDVFKDEGQYVIYLRNDSNQRAVAKTAISSVFYATHGSRVVAFSPGLPASPGLEALAEDGDAAALASEQALKAEIGISRATAGGPLLAGQRVAFVVPASIERPRLSLAAMIVESNDLFIATRPEGVAMIDDAGELASADELKRRIEQSILIWDAGSEKNEVPGVGRYQAPRQSAPNTGPPDSDSRVRFYADTTHDLAAGPALASFARIAIEPLQGTTFRVTVENVSGSSAFRGYLSPALWFLHDGSVTPFQLGIEASPGLEALAEDGNPTLLEAELEDSSIGAHAIEGSAPFGPGSTFSFDVTATPSHRFLNILSMVVPSNDTFLALGTIGVELVTEANLPRTGTELAVDVVERLQAYESGTEQNQASAIGPDMAGPGLQQLPNSGLAEGAGVSRLVQGGVWQFAEASDLVRVTISPIGRR